MPFENIRDLLPKAIDRSGDPSALLASHVTSLWPSVVRKTMKEAAWDKSVARKLSGGQLIVNVESPIWAQEFKLHFPKLIKEINRQARRNAVRQIFFRIR